MPAQAPAVTLKKHLSFTGLTVELFEDVEEVQSSLILNVSVLLYPRPCLPFQVLKCLLAGRNASLPGISHSLCTKEESAAKA